MCKIQILYHDKIGVSGGIYIDKTSASNFLFFFNKEFEFQQDVCNGWHDVLVMSMNLSNIAILKIKSADYCCIISKISKSGTIKLNSNINLIEKSRTL